MHASWQQFLNSQNLLDNPAARDEAARMVAEGEPFCSALPDLGVLKLAGVDARTFMQGYLTCDLDELTPTRASFGAYCDIKGRVVADFIVLACDDGLLLVTHRSLIGPACESLEKYLMFARSRLVDLSDSMVLVGLFNQDPEGRDAEAPYTMHGGEDAWSVAQPGSPARWLCGVTSEQAQLIWAEHVPRVGNDRQWQLADIRSGVAHVSAATSGHFLPQMLNLDEAGAISFTKGCYLGQEVVARAQHRGRVKRRLQRLTWTDQPGDAPAAGSELSNRDGVRRGVVINAVATRSKSGELLAVLNDAALDSTLHTDRLRLEPLPM